MSKNEKISYILAAIIGGIYLLYKQSREFNIVEILCFLIALILFFWFIQRWQTYWHKKDKEQ